MYRDDVRLRVVVAEDHPDVLERLTKALEGDYDVVASVLDGNSAVEETVRLGPDVLVCDISMPGMSGFDVARELRGRSAVKVVFVTNHRDAMYVTEAMRIGVSGYVLKSDASSLLVDAVRAASAEKTFLSPRLRANADPEPNGGG